MNNINNNLQILVQYKDNLKIIIDYNQSYLDQLFQQNQLLENRTELNNHIQLTIQQIEKYNLLIIDYKKKYNKLINNKYNNENNLKIYNDDLLVIENNLKILQIQKNTFQKIDNFFESLHQAFQIQSSLQNLVKKRKQLSNLL
jgi:hypothetical protein